MIYSVWSYASQSYDYYQGGQRTGTHAGAPPAPAFRHSVGATPEGASWRLPIGAKKIGSGPMPKGRIASSGIALGMGDAGVDLPTAAAVLAILYLGWKAIR